MRHLDLFAKIFGCVLAVPCAWSLASYWDIAPFAVLFVVLLAIIVFCVLRTQRSHFTKAEVISWAAFSTFLSISLVLGKHIVIESHAATKESCYIDPYSSMDVLACVLMALGIFLLVISAYRGLSSLGEKTEPVSSKSRGSVIERRQTRYDFSVRFLIIACAVMFVCWLPYLLAYWPGFIFGDSLNSARQALDINGYNVRHPIAYTLFIRGCINIVGMFGLDTTAGIALYSIIQMIVLAASFAFMVTWLGARFKLPSVVKAILVALFALTPYVATFSIAVWKDPFFCASFIVVTVILADLVSDGGIIKSRPRSVLYVIAALALCFSRKNGVYSLLLVALALAIMLIAVYCKSRKGKKRQQRENKPNERAAHFNVNDGISKGEAIQSSSPRVVLISTLAVCMISIVVTNILYGALDVDRSEEKIETYGVFMNQMAAVAAYDGELSDTEKKYLDSIFPLDEYENAYTPCIIDPLKWSKSFNKEPLEKGFLKNWALIGAKNPRIYFQAWELQTAGWWCLNNSMVNGFLSTHNISLGHPRNTTDDYPISYEKYHLEAENLLGSDAVRSVFVQDTWSIPVAYINWFVLFICICGFLRKRASYLLPIIPTIGLVIVLLVASPILYWPRYGAMEQFLLPFYACWLLALFLPAHAPLGMFFRKRKSDKKGSGETISGRHLKQDGSMMKAANLSSCRRNTSVQH